MFCPNCGANVDGQSYCPYCGTFISAGENNNDPNSTYDPNFSFTQNNSYNSYNNYNSPRYNAPQPSRPTGGGDYARILVYGILGLALSTIFFIGPIFAIGALVNYSRYVEMYGNNSGQARIGRVLAIIGLVISALFIVVVFLPSCAALTGRK